MGFYMNYDRDVAPRWGASEEWRLQPRVRYATLGLVVKRRWGLRVVCWLDQSWILQQKAVSMEGCIIAKPERVG